MKRALLAVMMVGSSLGGCGPSAREQARLAAQREASSVRFRLLLRENPVDRTEAFRCYGRCRSAATPEAYLNCLAECPGFEITAGKTCKKYEVPPTAACVTGRRVSASEEPPLGMVVVRVAATSLVAVTNTALCTLKAFDSENAVQVSAGSPGCWE